MAARLLPEERLHGDRGAVVTTLAIRDLRLSPSPHLIGPLGAGLTPAIVVRSHGSREDVRETQSMSWKLEGTYFENCNCDFACPCSVTSFAAPATQDRCHVILNYHIDRGEIDGVDVSGHSVSVVADAPAKMMDGNWRVGLIIDDKASKDQADKL